MHVLKAGCSWKDVRKYGAPTTIGNRFNRRSGRWLWTDILGALVAKGVLALRRPIDSFYVKAHHCANGGKGVKAQATGRSREGQTTKIHAATNLLVRPAMVRRTLGNVADVSVARNLLDAPGRSAASRGQGL